MTTLPAALLAPEAFDVWANHLSVGLCLLEADGHVIALNGTLSGILRIRGEEYSGKTITDLFSPGASQLLKTWLASAFSGESAGGLLETEVSSGHRHYLQTTITRHTGVDSDSSLFLGQFIDVTALCRSEEALQRTLAGRISATTALLARTEGRYRTIVDASPAWITLCDPQGSILTVNPAGCALLGMQESEILGHSIWELFHVPQEVELIRKAVETVTARLKFDSIDLTISRGDGEIRVVQAGFNPVAGDDPPCRLALIVTDITEIRQAEAILRRDRDELEQRVQERTEALRQMNDTLRLEIEKRVSAESELLQAKTVAENASRAKSAFLANVSHEIRTPMNAVLGFAVLLQRTQLTKLQTDYTNTILSSGRLLLSLLSDILDLSKIESGKLILEEIAFDIPSTVFDVINLFRPKTEEKKIDLRAYIEPPSLRPVIGDQMRFRQILINLIGNAVKFTSEGSVTTRLNCRYETKGFCDIEISIEDTGIGIHPDQINRLFNKFTQADSSTTRKFGGTGLGLAISKQLIEHMGGKIIVTSTPNIGSVFMFSLRLPVAETMDSMETISSSDQESRIEMRKNIDLITDLGRPLNILLVEDELQSQKLTRDCLERLGCRGIVVENGPAALVRLAEESFDLVLMDWQLPGMDGLETTREIRKREREKNIHPTLIVALTANAMKGDRDLCLEAGMDGYLTKPLDLEMLIALITDYIKEERIKKRA